MTTEAEPLKCAPMKLMPQFLVCGGDNYYPSAGMGDWKGFCLDLEGAKRFGERLKDEWVCIIDIRRAGLEVNTIHGAPSSHWWRKSLGFGQFEWVAS